MMTTGVGRPFPPEGGWPPFLVRLELDQAVNVYSAPVILSEASRHFRTGVVAKVSGADMVAYPHQTADEVRRTWAALLRPDDYGRIPLPAAGEVRWLAHRKLAVLQALEKGELTLDDCASRWAIDPAEVDAWRARYQGHGLEGLAVHKLQTLGRTE